MLFRRGSLSSCCCPTKQALLATRCGPTLSCCQRHSFTVLRAVTLTSSRFQFAYESSGTEPCDSSAITAQRNHTLNFQRRALATSNSESIDDDSIGRAVHLQSDGNVSADIESQSDLKSDSKATKQQQKSRSVLLTLTKPMRREATDSDSLTALCRDYWAKRVKLEKGDSGEQKQVTRLLAWRKLRDLWLAEDTQGVEHLPSDLTWEHRTKNAYLLDIQKCIENPQWRDWMKVCHNAVVPVHNASENVFGSDTATRGLFVKRTQRISSRRAQIGEESYRTLQKEQLRSLRRQYLAWNRSFDSYDKEHRRAWHRQPRYRKLVAMKMGGGYGNGLANASADGTLLGVTPLAHKNPTAIRGGISIPNVDFIAARCPSSSPRSGVIPGLSPMDARNNSVADAMDGAGALSPPKYMALMPPNGLIPEPSRHKKFTVLNMGRDALAKWKVSEQRSAKSHFLKRPVKDQIVRYILEKSLLAKIEAKTGTATRDDLKKIEFEVDSMLVSTKNDSHSSQLLSAAEKDSIIDRFFSRIRKSDLRLNAHLRWLYTKRYGNSPLQRRVYGNGKGKMHNSCSFDEEFTDEMLFKLRALFKEDSDMCFLLLDAWKKDRILLRWTKRKLCLKNVCDGKHPSVLRVTDRRRDIDAAIAKASKAALANVELEVDSSMQRMASVWCHKQRALLSGTQMADALKSGTGEFETSAAVSESDGHLPILAQRIDEMIEGIPASLRADGDLLKHSLEDVNKCVLLSCNGRAENGVALCNDVFAPEGYSGDNSSVRSGLWHATRLPIAVLRPHMLALRDIVCDSGSRGKYVEIRGKKGSGKSVALMYALSAARHLADTITVYCPNANGWVQTPAATQPSNTRPSLFYQKDYAHKTFSALIGNAQNARLLSSLRLQRDYPMPAATSVASIQRRKEQRSEVTREMVQQMLDDPIDLRRFEDLVIKEWAHAGDSDSHFYTSGFAEEMQAYAHRHETVLDLCSFGASAELCPNPCELLYDLMAELRAAKGIRTAVFVDGITHWNHLVYGLTSVRHPKVFAWQLSMVDLFAQLQQSSALPNGVAVMARTNEGKVRGPLFKTAPDLVVDCPLTYTPKEMDAALGMYQALGLSSPTIAPDDKKKIEAAAAKNPLFTQRLATLY